MPGKNSLKRANDVPTRLFLRVNFFKLLVTAPLLFLVSAGFAQLQDPSRGRSRVIDDTTKQIYGPNTSLYFYERDIFFNRDVLRPIDTLIRNFHRWDYVQRFNNRFQDIGNVGGAIRPIFYEQPDGIGVRSGAHVYDLYWDTETIKFFDTRSPYTNMKVLLGGNGRSITRAAFARNINPRWNIGFNYRGIFVDKQILRVGKGDRFARSNYYDVFTTFQNKDSTYRVFASMRRMFHRVEEPGGIKIQLDDDPLTELPEEATLADYFALNAESWLSPGPESNDLRIQAHLYHQYKVGKALQVYHVFDRYRQKNNFLHVASEIDDEYFDFEKIPADSLRDAAKLVTLRNEAGIKGNISKVFYNGYVAIRKFSYTNNKFNRDSLAHVTYDSLQFPTKGNESYLGGRIALNLDSIGDITGGIEVMADGNYQVYGEIKSKWFEANIRQMRYKPGFVEQAYRGAFDSWSNSFTSTQSTRLNGYLHYRSSVLNFSPGLTFTRLNNYIFYKKISDVDSVQQVLPLQSSGNQIIASPEARLSLTFFRHVNLSTQVIYTRLLENAGDAISIPELFVNAQLSYANILFNGNLDLHTGIDLHWKSDYYANGYDVAARQFYIQHDFVNPSFPLIDIFVNAKVKRGRVFFKYHNF